MKKLQGGYTLIELLVVTTLVILLMMSVSAMFMTYLVGNAQTNVRRQIKGEGNEMIDQLEYLFRNAQILTDNNAAQSPLTCTTSGTTINLDSEGVRLTDVDNNVFVITYSSNTISINSNALNTTYVVSSTPQLTCYGSATTQNKSIKFSFTLQWHDNSAYSDSFTTTVQVRNS